MKVLRFFIKGFLKFLGLIFSGWYKFRYKFFPVIVKKVDGMEPVHPIHANTVRRTYVFLRNKGKSHREAIRIIEKKSDVKVIKTKKL